MMPWRRRPLLLEPQDDPIKDWIPGFHPLLDIMATQLMLMRNQVELARLLRRSWRLWIGLALAWCLVGALNVFTVIGWWP